MSKKNPVYGQGYHDFADEQTDSYDPWHERYRYGSQFRRGPKNMNESPPLSKQRTFFSYKRADNKIWDDVCEILANAYELDASNMEVQVENSVVYLSGTVPSREDRFRAEQLAWDVAGVENVRNQIQVNANQKSFQADDHS